MSRCLQIGDVDSHNDIPDAEDAFFPSGVWGLITLSFLSHNSCQSLESLSIFHVSISEDDADGIFHMVAVINPLQYYFKYSVARGLDRPNTGMYGVRIPKDTVVTGEFGFEASDQYTVTLSADVEAILLNTNGDKAAVFIAGRGFCTLPRRSLSRKRTRLSLKEFNYNPDGTATAKLKTLELAGVPGDATTRTFLHDIFEFTCGSPLQALRLQIPGVDEETVHAALAHCPNLQHLTIADATLNSLAVVERAIAADGPLLSLELGPTNTPSSIIEAFLDKCRSRDGNVPELSKLERLRLRQRLEDATLDVLSQAARDPSSNLRYIHYNAAQPDQASYAEIAHATNGMPISMVREPLAASSRWAFLQALHGFEQSRLGMVFTDDLKALICSLAATPDTRTVVCEGALLLQQPVRDGPE